MNTISKKEFIEIWKNISNDERIKPKIVEHTNYNGDKYKTKEKGWLHSHHYMLYNAVRGLPLSRGFSEETEGYKNTILYFKTFTARYGINSLYEPFKGKLTTEQYLALVEDVKTMVS